MLFDTHAHYDDEAFDADRNALLAALPQRGVGLVLDPGCDVASSRRAAAYAAAYPHVYAASTPRMAASTPTCGTRWRSSSSTMPP